MQRPLRSSPEERATCLLAIGAALADTELAKTLHIAGEYESVATAIRKLAKGEGYAADTHTLKAFLEKQGVEWSPGEKAGERIVQRANLWGEYHAAMAWAKREFRYWLRPVGTMRDVVSKLTKLGYKTKGE